MRAGRERSVTQTILTHQNPSNIFPRRIYLERPVDFSCCILFACVSFVRLYLERCPSISQPSGPVYV
jgi:hypothetical protein